MKFKRSKKVTPIQSVVPVNPVVFNRPIFQSIDANDIRIQYREDSTK